MFYYLNVILVQDDLYIYLPVRKVILYENIRSGIYSSDLLLRFIVIHIGFELTWCCTICSIRKDITIKPCMGILIRILLARNSKSINTINRTERGS